MVARLSFIQFDISSRKSEYSASGHRVARVDCQIQKDLSDFSAICLDLSQPGLEINNQLDVFPDHALQHLPHVLNHSLETQYLGRANPTAAKGQHLAG